MPTTQVGRLVVRLGLNSKEFERGLNRNIRLASQAASRLTTVGRQLTSSVTLPIVLMGVAIVKTAADFDKSIRRVQALTGALGGDFDDLRQKALDLGRSTVFSAREVAQGMSFLAQAGLNTAEILETVQSSLDLAAAGAIDLSRAADITTNVMQAFGLEASETGRVTDVLAKTFARTNTDIEQLADAMKLAAPVANKLGISVEELSSALGFLGDAGLQGTIAGTSLNQAFQSLLTNTPKTQAALERLGVGIKDSITGEMRPLHDILIDLEESAKTFGSSLEFITQVVAAFGTRGSRSIASLIGRGEELRDFTARVHEVGFAAAIAEKQMDGLHGSLVFLKSAIEGAAIAIGDAGLSAFIKKAAEDITKFARAVALADASTIQLGLLIGAVVALAGPLLGIIGLATTGVVAIFASPIAFVGIAAVVSAAMLVLKTEFGDIIDVAKAAAEEVKNFKDEVKLFKGTKFEDSFASVIAVRNEDRAKRDLAAAQQNKAALLASQSGPGSNNLASFIGRTFGVGQGAEEVAALQKIVDLKAAVLEKAEEHSQQVFDQIAAKAFGREIDKREKERKSIADTSQALTDRNNAILKLQTDLATKLSDIDVFAGLTGQDRLDTLGQMQSAVSGVLRTAIEEGPAAAAAVEVLAAQYAVLATSISDIEAANELTELFKEETAEKARLFAEGVKVAADNTVEAKEKLAEMAAEVRNLEASLADISGEGTGSLELATLRFNDFLKTTDLVGLSLAETRAEFARFQAQIQGLKKELVAATQAGEFFQDLGESLKGTLTGAIQAGFEDGLDGIEDFAKNAFKILQKKLIDLLAEGLIDTLGGILGGGETGGGNLLASGLEGIFGAINGAAKSFTGFLTSVFGRAPAGGGGGGGGSGLLGSLPGDSGGGALGGATDVVSGVLGLVGGLAGAIPFVGIGLSLLPVLFDGIKSLIKLSKKINTDPRGPGLANANQFQILEFQESLVIGGFDIINLIRDEILGSIPVIGSVLGKVFNLFFGIAQKILGIKFRAKVRLITLPNEDAFEFEQGISREGPFGFVGAAREESKRLTDEFRIAFAESIVEFDKKFAANLTEADILKVRENLPGIFTVVAAFRTFDNELSEILLDRIKAILTSLGADARSFFGDFPNNVKTAQFETEVLEALGDFFSQRQEIQELRDILFGFKVEEPSEADAAIEELKKRFDELRVLAPRFGVDIGDIDDFEFTRVEEELGKRLAEMTAEFNENVLKSIQSLDFQGQQGTIDKLLRDQRARFLDAVALGGDLEKVLELSEKEQQLLIDEFGSGIVQTLDEIRRNAGGTASPLDLLSEAQKEFDELLAGARSGNVSDFIEIGASATRLINAQSNVLGNGAAFFDSLEFIKLTLENLLESGADLFGLNEVDFSIPTLEESAATTAVLGQEELDAIIVNGEEAMISSETLHNDNVTTNEILSDIHQAQHDQNDIDASAALAANTAASVA